MSEKKAAVVGLLALVLATPPIFFDIYRSVAFNTFPHDDYAPYLLALVGQGNNIPGAPYAYRILSVAVAIPFYYIIPTFSFSYLHDVDPAYLKAVQALSFSSYFWLILTPPVIYKIARTQCSATRASALVVALVTFFLSGFISKVGVDPFAIFIISLLVLCWKNPLIFAPLVLASIGVNEKIPILFAAILACRLATSIMRRHRFTMHVQLLFSCIAAAGYFTLVFFLKVPGCEEQTNPAMFLTNLQTSLIYTFSLKGFFMNVVPVLILLIVVVLAIKFRRRSSFQASDVSGLFILLILSSIANTKFNVGRIVMYTYPLYLPAVSVFIDDVLEAGYTPQAPS